MPGSCQATRSPKGSECQCPACGRFFTSPSGFDFHQWWRGRGDKARLVCFDPAAIGMVDRQRTAGETWGLPDRETGKGGAVALRNDLIDRLSQQEGSKTGSDAPSQP
jgi:hypothetical protein